MGRRLQSGSVRAIGGLEVLGAVGLILPAVLDIAPTLVPLATLGLVMVMVGAVVTRIRRHEFKIMVADLVYLGRPDDDGLGVAGAGCVAAASYESVRCGTAILALNDDMAIGVLSVLRASGVAVPEHVSVVGFDDVAVAQDLAPSLTTVRLPMVEMGEKVLQLALADPSDRPRRRRVGHQLVVRGSTAQPPA